MNTPTSDTLLAQQAIKHFRAYIEICEHFQKKADNGDKTSQYYLELLKNPNQFISSANVPVSSNNMQKSASVSTLVGPPASANNQQHTPELNYYAPKFHLQRLLKQPWFKKKRTKDEYDEQWTDGFISGLMDSEWKDDIARDWAVQGRRPKVNQIKGHIVGLLADEGVLKGSYDSIAAEISITEKPRTFSKYMSAGKAQPYADWVKDYVSRRIKK